MKRERFIQAVKTAAGIAGDLLALAMMAALFWLFLVSTPSQSSAEADWIAAECETTNER